MFEKAQQLWQELDQEITVNKREMALCLVCAALAGAVLGTLLAPNVTVTIGSHNHIDREEPLPGENKETSEE